MRLLSRRGGAKCGWLFFLIQQTGIELTSLIMDNFQFNIVLLIGAVPDFKKNLGWLSRLFFWPLKKSMFLRSSVCRQPEEKDLNNSPAGFCRFCPYSPEVASDGLHWVSHLFFFLMWNAYIFLPICVPVMVFMCIFSCNSFINNNLFIFPNHCHGLLNILCKWHKLKGNFHCQLCETSLRKANKNIATCR